MSDEHDAVALLLARDEIRRLPYSYAAAVEARDVDGMAQLFAPDASFGDYGTGVGGLRRLMVDSLHGSMFAVILVANHLIEVIDRDHATGQVWAHCFAQTRADGFVEQLIKYEDRYVRIEGRWLFAHRRHRLWYGSRHDASPLLQEPADWPRRQTGVGDLPLADGVFVEWWREKR